MPLFHDDSLGARLADAFEKLPSADDEFVSDQDALQAAQDAVNEIDRDPTQPAWLRELKKRGVLQQLLFDVDSEESPSDEPLTRSPKDVAQESASTSSDSIEPLSPDTHVSNTSVSSRRRPPAPFPAAPPSASWPPEHTQPVAVRIVILILVLLVLAFLVPGLIWFFSGLLP